MLNTIAYLGTQEIWIIAGVVIVLFGGAKMTQLGRGLGEGIREFKKGMNGDGDKAADEKTDTVTPVAPSTTAEAK